MIRIVDKAQCCGCTACVYACARKCVEMERDVEGFLYPAVNVSECVECGLCEKVCPIIHHKGPNSPVSAYTLQHKDKKTLMQSAAGGAFSAIAKVILNLGGHVYGAAYDEHFVVIHEEAHSQEDAARFRSSKYVQSDLGSSFFEIRKLLEQGETVCFSGTPCQVAGLKNYLGKEYEKLFTVDLVCKGVASPEVLRQYVELMEGLYKSRIIGMNFKRKTYGYHSSTMSVDFSDGRSYAKGGIVDPMMRSFRANICLRPSCGECHFKGISRDSDLTLFDCWSYEKLTGRKDDDGGHTAILVHTSKGEDMLCKCQEYAKIEKINAEEAIRWDGNMVNNRVSFHQKREEYMHTLSTNGLEAAINQTIPVSMKEKILDASKKLIYKSGLLDLVKQIGGRQEIR